MTNLYEMNSSCFALSAILVAMVTGGPAGGGPQLPQDQPAVRELGRFPGRTQVCSGQPQ